MKLHELRPAKGSVKLLKRVGRGHGSGMGKTSTRGNNGQGQRSGDSKKPGFEGGQMPLFRRTPKKHHFQRPERYLLKWEQINVGRLNDTFSGDSPIDHDMMAEAGLVSTSTSWADDANPKKVLDTKFDGVRILGDGEVTKKLEIHAHHFTKGAREKIEAAGGKCILLGDQPPATAE